MGSKIPQPDEGTMPNRQTNSRVAPLYTHATPHEQLTAIMRRIGADQPPSRTNYNPGAAEYRPAYGYVGDGTGGSSSIGASIAPARPQPSVMLNHETMGPHFPQAYNPVNAGMYGPAGPAGSVLMQNFGYTGGEVAGAHSDRMRSGASTGFGRPAGGTVVQSGVLRGGRGRLGRLGRPPGPVQLLSYECQTRSFNPEFRVTMYDKRYKCDILVRGELIQGSQRCDEPQDAKNHTAIKALKVVQQWPIPDLDSSPQSDWTNQATRSRQNHSHIKQQEKEEEVEEGSRFERRPRVASPTPRPSRASGVDMTNPLQARAFVEGYRMGQAGAAHRSSPPDFQAPDFQAPDFQVSNKMLRRSRSRSPRHDHRRERRSCTYRSRSARRHDPALPSSDSYRPGSPVAHRPGFASARRNADKLKVEVEDNYGRLKREDHSN